MVGKQKSNQCFPLRFIPALFGWFSQSYADSTSSELFWTAKCGHLHCRLALIFVLFCQISVMAALFRLCAEKQKKIRCCVCQSSPIKSPKAHQTASTLLAQLREMENLLVGDRSASEDEPSKVFDFPEEVELSPPTNKRRKSESDGWSMINKSSLIDKHQFQFLQLLSRASKRLRS